MKRNFWLGTLIFLASFGFRVWNIGVDLPNIYHPDEPHHLNIAARFGTGDLNPHDFKYPTLWPYIIAVLYGVLFVFQKAFGEVSNLTEFGVKFVTDPSLFYFSVRLLAAAMLGFASVLLFTLGARLYSVKAGVFIGFLSALSPTLMMYGRDGTHYPAMLFFTALSLNVIAATYKSQGSFKYYCLSGFLIGITTSVHYIAAPLVLFVPAVYWALPQNSRSFKSIFCSGVLFFLGFFIASPFILVEFDRFLADIAGIGVLQKGSFWNESQFSWLRLQQIFLNLVRFIDAWGAGLFFVIFAIWESVRRRQKDILIWILPALLVSPVLGLLRFGSLERYSFSIYFPLFIPAGVGLAWVWDYLNKRTALKTLLLMIFIPSLVFAIQTGNTWGLSDTRTEAKEWVQTNIPAGRRIFRVDPYSCPQLPQNREQLTRLYQRSQQLRHPREDYYRLKLLGAGEGGYEIFSLRRTDFEVMDIPHRTEASYQAQEAIDVKSEGLDGLRRNGIEFVIINPVSDNDPNYQWISELRLNAIHLVSFLPIKGHRRGPPVEIFQFRDKHEQ